MGNVKGQIYRNSKQCVGCKKLFFWGAAWEKCPKSKVVYYAKEMCLPCYEKTRRKYKRLKQAEYTKKKLAK